LRHTLSAPTGVERDLIDAAVAVNEAPTLDDAFAILARTGLDLSGADAVTIASWDADRSTGFVRAAVGDAVGHRGLRIPADRATRTVLKGTPYVGPPEVDGALLEVRPYLLEMSTIVRVGLETPASRVTLQASYRSETSQDGLEAVASMLETLIRLTSIAERAQREQGEARLDSVLEATSDAVALTVGNRCIPNTAARRLLAIPHGEDLHLHLVAPRTLDGVPLPSEPNRLGGAKTLQTDQGNRFRLRATALDGRELVIDGSSSPLEDGAVIVFRDVTDEYEREFVTEQYLRALFDTIPTAINVIDPETGEVLSANRRFLALVGLELDQVAGCVPPYPWWGENEVLGDPSARSLDRIYRHASGRPVPVHIDANPIVGADGSTVAHLGLISDLSERRRFEKQLVQSGKLAAIGELAAGVAHEINNPLFAILGLTEFLLKEASPGSKAHSRLELIQQTGIEIKEIVRALLDFARENAEERHLVVLEDVVRATLDLVDRTNAHKGVELVARYDGSLATVSASPNQLKQIFLNLIANARQAMPAGGTVTVEVRAEGNHVLATITDDGPGLEPAVAERIFEPFFTTKRSTGGTGLGLSVSLGIAESHGGSLTVESEHGEGAAFTLQLPIAEAVA